jgi:hypothetical protein
LEELNKIHQGNQFYKSQHIPIRRKSLKNNTYYLSSSNHLEVDEPLLRQSDGLKMRKSQSLIDQSKINQGKTFLKGKARDSFRKDNRMKNESQ